MGLFRETWISGARVYFLKMAVCCSATLAAPSLYAEDVLFKYQGKSIGKKELLPGDQQKIGELESHFHAQMTQLVEEIALNYHLESLAKKLGKTREEVEKSLLSVVSATDDEAKQWFEQNKDRIPPDYGFDKVKEEIKKLLVQEKTDKKRNEVMAGLNKSGDLQLMLKEPELPSVTIDTAGRPQLGDAKAPLTLVEFADYQCPHCQAAGKMIKEVMQKYPGKIKLIYMDFPINPSGVSKLVAQGAFCANKQGKFWEYHELAFSKQKELSDKSPENIARELSLKVEDFKTCLVSNDAKDKVTKDQKEGERLGISGTPTIFLNGKKIHSHNESELTRAIEKALQAKSS
jgi:protein-disulfide isomerase